MQPVLLVMAWLPVDNNETALCMQGLGGHCEHQFLAMCKMHLFFYNFAKKKFANFVKKNFYNARSPA